LEEPVNVDDDGPDGLRVSATRHGVTRKKLLPHEGPATIGNAFDAVELHPLVAVTVTASWVEPLVPEVNVMLSVPSPDVIVPFVIDQLYAAPAMAGTDAVRPLVLGQTEAGAVMSTAGFSRTVAIVVAADEEHR
jgi:hypothetical protein